MRTDQGDGGWHDDGIVAWTEGDGPGRPPGGPSPWLTSGVGVGLLAVFSAILVTDTLCPEHRAWVAGMATIAMAATVVAGVGMFRGWASAAPLSVLATGLGVGIGILDSIHSASRGSAIAAAFGVLSVGALFLLWRQVALLRWDREVRRSLGSEPVEVVAAPAEVAAEVEAPPARRTTAST
jgi:hypothetical protein